MNIDMHAENISIRKEFPSNGRFIELRIEERGSVTKLGLFINDVSQWWALRTSIPKHAEYYLRSEDQERLTGDMADKYARSLYDEFLTELSAA